MDPRAEVLRTTLLQAGLPAGLPLEDTLRASEALAWRLSRALTAALEGGRSGPVDVEGTLEAPATGSVAISVELPRITLSWGDTPPPGETPSERGGGGDYEVLGVLAEGGMGRLLRTRQRTLGREVVIKQVKPELATPSATAALLTEARIAGSLEHPSIVPVHALGRDSEGRPLLVMKKIEGVVWRALVEQPDHPDWERVAPGRRDRLAVHLSILTSVCNAVHYAHNHGVLHRDLKADNVMVGYFGEVYLVDWGVALRRSEAKGPGPVVGTPVYMAPEMLSGRADAVDERTDVYLLGATLHHVLTGRYRHEGQTLPQVALSVHLSAPVAYDEAVPAELAAICNRATAARPEHRFATAQALREAVEEYLRHKDSIELTDRTLGTLDEALALLAREQQAPDSVDPAPLRRRLIECQFGFEQALAAHADNARAREGLGRCLGAQLDHALTRENLEEARALFAACPAPQPSQRARLAALEERMRAQRDASAQLQKLQRDLDPSVGAGPRRALFMALAACIVLMCFVFGPQRMATVQPRVLVVISAIFSSVLLAALWALWRPLSEGSINRRLLGLLSLVALALPTNRVAGVIEGVTASHIVLRDVQILTVIMAAGAVGIHRRLWVAAAAGLVCWSGGLLRPELVGFGFVGTALVACAGVILLWSPKCEADERAEPRPAEAP